MIRRISAAFVFLLVFLTLLGHACELPIGMMVAAHAHDEARDSSDHHATDSHHADDSQFECDAVLAVPSSTQTASNVALAAPARPLPILDTVALPVGPARPDAHAKYRRPPLFLLHAALLI